MVPARASGSATVRRSERLSKVPGAALPADANNRITKPPPPPKTPRFPCSTCDRDLAASAFFKTRSTKRCAHQVHTCKTSLKAWLTMQLESTTYDKLSCPQCPEIMQHADVKRCATKEAYDKYDELERRAIQDNTPGWRWCLAPTCRAGQVHGLDSEAKDGKPARKATRTGKRAKDVDDSVFTCETCGARACVPCDRPYHEDETCAQYQKRAQQQNGVDEEAWRKTIAKECKRCPTCAKLIGKDGGCDQVQCTQCRTEFCWLCVIDYKVVNTKGHAAGCTYAKPGRFDPHAAPDAPNNVAAAQAGNDAVAARMDARPVAGWEV